MFYILVYVSAACEVVMSSDVICFFCKQPIDTEPCENAAHRQPPKCFLCSNTSDVLIGMSIPIEGVLKQIPVSFCAECVGKEYIKLLSSLNDKAQQIYFSWLFSNPQKGPSSA